VPPASEHGLAAVGELRAMPPARSLAIRLLRDGLAGGPAGRRRMAALLAAALGPQGAAPAIAAWEDLAGALALHARRPLRLRPVACALVGADEAAASLAIGLAAQGEREEALLMLSLLVRADRMLPALDAAERWGLSLERVARGRPRPPSRLH
jgi:hypothetical protein